MSSTTETGNTRPVTAALTVLVATQAAVVMAFFAVPVLGVDVASRLSLPVGSVGYFTSVAFAAALVSAFVSGSMVDRFGPVRTSQITVALAAFGLLMIAVPHIACLIIAALVLGFAYGPGNPASSALLSRLAPPERRGMIFSIKQTAVPLGGLFAGIALPFLVSTIGFEAAFIVAAAVCISILVIVQFWRKALDVVVRDRPRTRTPFGELLARPMLRRLAVFSAAMAGIQFTFGAVFVTFLQMTANVPAVVAGPVLSVAMGASIVARILLGLMADRIGGIRVLFGLAVLSGISTFALVITTPAGFSFLAIFGILLGTIAFSWNGVFLSEVAFAARSGSVATATAGAMFFVFLGGVIGPAVASSLAIWTGSYASAFIFMISLAVIAACAVSISRHSTSG